MTIVGWLLYGKTRPYAYAALVLFHAATGLLFPTIGVFPILMTGAALIFFSPDWPTHLVRRLRRLRASATPLASSPAPPPETRPLPWLLRAAFILGVVFLVLQVMMPLRHLAYLGTSGGTKRVPVSPGGSGHREDGSRQVSRDCPCHGRREVGVPRSIPDAGPSGAYGFPAGYDPGYRPPSQGRFHPPRVWRGRSPGRRSRHVQRVDGQYPWSIPTPILPT